MSLSPRHSPPFAVRHTFGSEYSNSSALQISLPRLRATMMRQSTSPHVRGELVDVRKMQAACQGSTGARPGAVAPPGAHSRRGQHTGELPTRLLTIARRSVSNKVPRPDGRGAD